MTVAAIRFLGGLTDACRQAGVAGMTEGEPLIETVRRGLKRLALDWARGIDGGLPLSKEDIEERAADVLTRAGMDPAEAFKEAARIAEGAVRAAERQPGAVDIETAEASSRFRLLTDSEIETREPPEMQIANVMPAGGLGEIYGPPGSLKTFVMIYGAMSVQTGADWCGHATKRGNVVYVVAEPGSRFGLRVAAHKAWHKIEGDTGARWIFDAVQLSDPAEIRGQVAAIEDATSEPIALIVYDTLARCSVGAEENSATDAGRIIAGCDYIRRETGAAVWLVHHTDKVGLRERGSSAFRGAMDTMVSCSADGDFVTLKCEKQKDLEPFRDITLRKRVIELGDDATSLILEPASHEELTRRPDSRDQLTGSARAVFDALDSFGSAGATASEWERSSGLSGSTFYRARRLLVDQWEFVKKQGQRYQVSV